MILSRLPKLKLVFVVCCSFSIKVDCCSMVEGMTGDALSVSKTIGVLGVGRSSIMLLGAAKSLN